MASTSEELFAAVEAGDVERVRALLDDDPSLARARDGEDVSALMRARYRSDKPTLDVLLARVAELDLFETAAFGDLDRMTELLAHDPGSVGARSGDGFTTLHLAAFFGGADGVRLLVSRGAEVDARGTGWMTGTPLHSATSAGH
ncbi:MAG: ankyrin repeat domain-containing protein, partial [Actinomycetota bacterium]